MDPLDACDLGRNVIGDPDGSTLICHGARHGLANPPRRIRAELEPALMLELLGSAHQTTVALLDQIKQMNTSISKVLGNGNDQAKVAFT